MKKSLLTLLALTAFGSAYATVDGDVNGDGNVTSADITVLYNYLLNDDTEALLNGDVDGDGCITSGDVTYVYNILLGNTPQPVNHDYVDMGLPSGTLWATMNIGANAPEEYGDYFAWGETTPKDVYKWDNYQWSNGTRFNKLIKYCNNSNYGYNGFVDDLTELETEDDAATANWGSQWCMPSDEQLSELIAHCNWQWTAINGVNGYKATSKHNGATLFLPAAGYYFGVSDVPYSVGTIAYYWSRMVNTSKCYQAHYLWFNNVGNLEMYYGDRDTGYTVRPVRVAQK